MNTSNFILQNLFQLIAMTTNKNYDHMFDADDRCTDHCSLNGNEFIFAAVLLLNTNISESES